MNHRIAGILPRGFSVRAVEFRNGQREVTACALPGCVRTNMRECVPPPCTTSHAGGSCSQPPARMRVPSSCARSCSCCHGAQAQAPRWGAPCPGPSELLGTPGLPRDEPGFPGWHGLPCPHHCAPLRSLQLHSQNQVPAGPRACRHRLCSAPRNRCWQLVTTAVGHGSEPPAALTPRSRC